MSSKRCPFCGSQPEIFRSPLHEERYAVRCSKCACVIFYEFDTVDEAYRLWNSRNRKNTYRVESSRNE